MTLLRHAAILIAPLVLGVTLSSRAAAQELAPEELVRRVTAEVIESIHADAQLRAGDRARALALAEQKVLPLIDFREMTRLAAGKAWHTAAPAQRESLVQEFRSMLVRTYANAVGVYGGQTMRVLPSRASPDATEVTVRNLYLRPGRPSVPVDYTMMKNPRGWKIVDITVAGVSLVLTYRSEFEEAAQRSGIDGLIAQMRAKNRPAGPAP